MKTVELASLAYTGFYNTPIMGRGQIERMDAADSGGHATVAGTFSEPVELKRINRHGFIIVTNHFSQASIDYALAEDI